MFVSLPNLVYRYVLSMYRYVVQVHIIIPGICIFIRFFMGHRRTLFTENTLRRYRYLKNNLTKKPLGRLPSIHVKR